MTLWKSLVEFRRPIGSLKQPKKPHFPFLLVGIWYVEAEEHQRVEDMELQSLTLLLVPHIVVTLLRVDNLVEVEVFLLLLPLVSSEAILSVWLLMIVSMQVVLPHHHLLLLYWYHHRNIIINNNITHDSPADHRLNLIIIVSHVQKGCEMLLT